MLKKIATYLLLAIYANLSSSQTIFVGGGNGLVAKCDIFNCTYQIIGNVEIPLADIALTPNGKLYGTPGQSLLLIDTSDASTILIGWIMNEYNYINALVAIDDQYLLGMGGLSDTLWRISVNDASKTMIGKIGYNSDGDLTFYKGLLYLSGNNGDLISIKISDDYNHVLSVQNIGHMTTPSNRIYGVLTIGNVNCNYDSLRMIAFEDATVYEVDPTDAHVTLLCDTFMPLAGWGGASKIETHKQEYSAVLTFPNVFTPNNDGYNDFFKPIEIKNMKETNVIIYNRWGRAVFVSNDIDFFWDGRAENGEVCSDGIYYFIFEYLDNCNNRQEYKGTLTLIR
jgi:gliding motility-associated-like protein